MGQDTKSGPKSSEEIGSITHKIRNSLTIVKGNIDLAKIQQKSGATNDRSILDKISVEVKNISELLDQLEN